MEKIACITGASSGIGRETALILAENGYKLILCGRRKDRLEALQKEILVNSIILIFDVRDLGQVQSSFASLSDEWKNIDVLINNAGWIGQIDYFGKLEAQNIQAIHNINTIAPALLMNEFVRKYHDSKNTECTVINISSGAAKKGIDGWSGYSSSKAALNMMTEAAQEEANKSNSKIKFFALSPGVVDTNMQEDIRSAPENGFSLLGKFKGLKAD